MGLAAILLFLPRFCGFFYPPSLSCRYRLPGLARLEVGNETDDTGDSPPVPNRQVKPVLSTRGRGLPVCVFQGSPGVSRGPFSLFLFLIDTLTRIHKDQLSLTGNVLNCIWKDFDQYHSVLATITDSDKTSWFEEEE